GSSAKPRRPVLCAAGKLKVQIQPIALRRCLFAGIGEHIALARDHRRPRRSLLSARMHLRDDRQRLRLRRESRSADRRSRLFPPLPRLLAIGGSKLRQRIISWRRQALKANRKSLLAGGPSLSNARFAQS